MKKFLVLLLSVLCLITLFACSNVKEEESKDLGTSESVYAIVGETRIDYDSYIYTFYHKETKVMYMFYAGYRKGGLTMLVDENGKPLLYKGEKK